jgi:predicted metal-dependent hydrolase
MMVQRDRRDDGRPEQARPRDRTGRPLPYGTVGIATTEPVEVHAVARALELGAARWSQQRYFEAHELLEIVWKASSGPERELWKGVIQVAVAAVHVQRGNPVGAQRLIARATRRLEPFDDLHVGRHGVLDVGEVRRQAMVLAARVDAAGDSPAALDVDLGRLPVDAS